MAAHQSCTQSGGDIKFSSIQTVHQAGGTGNGFDGKPSDGEWNRTFPEYACPNAEDLVQATISMGGTTGALTSDNCVPTPIVISKFDPEINFRFYNPDYFIFSGAIFEIYKSGIPAHVNEALCRVQIDGVGVDAIIKSETNGVRTANIITGNYTSREINSSGYTNIVRTETDSELKFSNGDKTLSLSIRGSPTSYKNLDGTLLTYINGEPKEYSMTCQKMSRTSVLESVITNFSTLYVDRESGTDANTGLSEATAFFSVARCASIVKPGDTCVVKKGTYTEDVLLRNSGTASSRITFRNFPGDRPLLDFIGTSGNSRFELLSSNFRSIPMSYVTIEGFEIASGEINGLKYYFGTELIIRNNHFRDNPGGYCLLGSAYRVRIENNRFTRCSSAILITGQQNVIVNNIFEQNGGIAINAQAYPFDSATFTDPLFFDFRDNVLAHNILAYNAREGITLSSSVGGTVVNNLISNNIFYENCRSCSGGRPQGIRYFSPDGNGDRINNNLFFATAGGIVPLLGEGARFQTTQYTESANFFNVQNPLFVNAPTTPPQLADYHLQSGSPAIDRGTSLINIVPQDFDGNSRPRGTEVDMGAFEF